MVTPAKMRLNSQILKLKSVYAATPVIVLSIDTLLASLFVIDYIWYYQDKWTKYEYQRFQCNSCH